MGIFDLLNPVSTGLSAAASIYGIVDNIKAAKEQKKEMDRLALLNKNAAKWNRTQAGNATRSSFPVNGIDTPLFAKFGAPNVIAETGEMVTHPEGAPPQVVSGGAGKQVSSQATELQGAPHELGGMGLAMTGTVWSDTTKPEDEVLLKMLKSLGVSVSSKDTFSDVVKRLEQKRSKVEKLPETDLRTRNTKSLTNRNIDAVLQMLEQEQEAVNPTKDESSKGIPEAQFGLTTIGQRTNKDKIEGVSVPDFTPGKSRSFGTIMSNIGEGLPIATTIADFISQRVATNKMAPPPTPLLASRVKLNKTMDTSSASRNIGRSTRTQSLAADKLRDSQVAAGLKTYLGRQAQTSYLDLLNQSENYKTQTQNMEAQMNQQIDFGNTQLLNQHNQSLVDFRNARRASLRGSTSDLLGKVQMISRDQKLDERDAVAQSLTLSTLNSEERAFLENLIKKVAPNSRMAKNLSN